MSERVWEPSPVNHGAMTHMSLRSRCYTPRCGCVWVVGGCQRSSPSPVRPGLSLISYSRGEYLGGHTEATAGLDQESKQRGVALRALKKLIDSSGTHVHREIKLLMHTVSVSLFFHAAGTISHSISHPRSVRVPPV